ncbi:MAG: hypothetical protein WC708_12520, partial [Lentisphaeria bacterium]
LSLWLPQFSFGTEVKQPVDTYHFRSALAGGVVVTRLFAGEWSLGDRNYPCQWLRDRLDEFHRAKAYFSGDFYPLLEQSDSFKDWSAYQFHRPDLDGGLLLVFRKRESNIEKIRFPLQGVATDAEYELDDRDGGKTRTVSGAALATEGVAVELLSRRESRLFFYHRKSA